MIHLIEKIKQDINHFGYSYLNDIPDDFDHFKFAQNFGTPMPQYNDQLIWDIAFKAGFDNVYHSLNSKKLYPHTECYEFEGLPNKFQILWCVVEPSCGGGDTTLLDSRIIFQSVLTPEEINYLFEKKYHFFSTEGLRVSHLGKTALHPVLEKVADEIVLRYSYNNMQTNGDEKIISILQKILDFYEENCFCIEWKKNAFLIWDNYRMLHSRTAFEDKKRILKRVFLT